MCQGSPVGQLAKQHRWEQVQAINDPVKGRLYSGKEQAGGEEIHDGAQLLVHLRGCRPQPVPTLSHCRAP